MLFFQTLFAQSVQKKTYPERWTRYARAHRNKSNDAEWRSGLIRYFACIGDDGKRKKGKGAAKWRRRKEYDVLNILKVRPHLNWNVFEIIRPWPPFCPRLLLFRSRSRSIQPIDLNILNFFALHHEIQARHEFARIVTRIRNCRANFIGRPRTRAQGTVNDSLIAESGRLKICNR